MNFIFSKNSVSVGRDITDKKIYKESTVTYKIIKALNERDGIGVWKRFYPDRYGLTSCRQGFRNSRTGEYYWHERYQIESACEAFNNGGVTYFKA